MAIDFSRQDLTIEQIQKEYEEEQKEVESLRNGVKVLEKEKLEFEKEINRLQVENYKLFSKASSPLDKDKDKKEEKPSISIDDFLK